MKCLPQDTSLAGAVWGDGNIFRRCDATWGKASKVVPRLDPIFSLFPGCHEMSNCSSTPHSHDVLPPFTTGPETTEPAADNSTRSSPEPKQTIPFFKVILSDIFVTASET